MKRMHISLTLGVGLTLVGACTQFPDLDRNITPELASADYPALVPMDPILTQARTIKIEPVQATVAIDARVAALKSRAARLRGSVLTGRERQRLEEGLR
jgi:hypothetical protein